MNHVARQRAAAIVAAIAGLVALATAATLTVDSLVARHRRPHDQARVDELLKQVRTDAARAIELQAEYDRQTDLSLRRDSYRGRLAQLLLTASVIFLIGAKRFISLRAPRPSPAKQVLALHLASAAGAGCHGDAARRHDTPASPTTVPPDLSVVDQIVERLGRGSSATIPVLQAIQAQYRYLPDAALQRVCELTEITPAQLVGVASFYPQFRRTPMGEHLVTVCHGTACHVAGAVHISDELRRYLNISPAEDTDPRGQFTVQTVPCLGCCTLAPAVQIDSLTHGHVRADTIAELLDDRLGASAVPPTATQDLSPAHLRHGDAARRHGTPAPVGEIRVGLGSCCVANGSGALYRALQAALAASGADAVIKPVGCVGVCHQTPRVEVITPGRSPRLYRQVQSRHAGVIVRRHFRATGLARRLRSAATGIAETLRRNRTEPPLGELSVEPRDPATAAFLDRQKRIATEHCGELDPLDLDEYLGHDGFQGLKRCLTGDLTPEQVIEEIRRSGLRGRGGAGYPTWIKWAKLREAAGSTRYVICNGDEGDPGAFMDRMLMESYPYRVLEGIAIAAYATGATEGWLYVRAEYRLAVERLTEALRRCNERGLLGGVGPPGNRPLHLHIMQGAGAFVCGEETALIATLEGRRGTPRLRPPYPAEQGLWGRPTLVNNVETFAIVPWILRNGANAFAALGTAASKGTKVFALAGKVRRGGLIEVPMGITIRQIVEEIGGGVREEQTAAGRRPRRFKAVQIGGPSGGCIPAELADTPVDYEALGAVGAIMGSGGLVVLDETDCMVDIARYFLAFTQGQSCGKCAPCRIGTRRMLEILDRLCAGQGRADDLEKLEHLARMVRGGSLCGLGQTAPNPVLTTLHYFRDEYQAHLAGRCPAGKCRALIAYAVTEDCTGCTLCAQHCPTGAIALRPYERHEIDADKCTRCDVCRIRCPEDAIRVE
jgi:NADH:ubiquinone oxidoreductase subunit F (NADH-binding)/NADH:ubiquinone oxidoreductase subunit E